MTTFSKFAHKTQVLSENYRTYTGGDLSIEQELDSDKMSFVEYVQNESEQDPNFFRWFFDAELEHDFDTSLSEEQQEIWAEYLGSVNSSY